MNNIIEFDRRLRGCLSDYQPNVLDNARRKAAVLVPIVMTPVPSVLLTVRAAHLNSHPGEVSFPGGMSEDEDDSLSATALRETFEEIALEHHRFDVVGELSTTLSKDGVLVYPIVGIIESSLGSLASPDEIAEVFTVPWSYFSSATPDIQTIEREGEDFHIPHFQFEGKHIWGLTAMILIELINLVEGTQWPIPDFSRLLNNS